jgi:pyruvate/2-oxoglutarate dehydrogenase complex dihydrolipoamide acyltransferase (E2) component
LTVIVEVRLPQWGMGMTEGTVVEWECEVGDEIVEGDVLAEIEVAKTTQELLSPVAGTVEAILVKAEETAEVRDVLLTVRTA